ncbi:MAG: histidine--tRNA ligase [Ginsengibacter sp.]
MKPTIPQGSRDFGAEILQRRRYIIETIKKVFEVYGFEPLETPAMENLETLMGKYGEEGDKLIFKVLNNGLDNPAKKEKVLAGFDNILLGKNEKVITERALRYDLTIPFARYVAMNYGQLTFPYKRYQVQPVWRADRPQKGRYREFYQCDADVAGTFSLLSDVEFAQIYLDTFSQLRLDVKIKINNRKVLYALAEVCNNLDKMVDITTIIDKLDKIGLEKIKEELTGLGLLPDSILLIENYIGISGNNIEKLEKLEVLISASETGRKGVEELKYILSFIDNKNVVIDFTLARGLNYYTGTIYEVSAKNVQMGSIGGGGRYNDLTGLFGVPNVPGVGISFGLDRIYDVMEELDLFPKSIQKATQALFFNMGEEEAKSAYEVMQECRLKGIACELFYEKTKLEKQFKYATKKNIVYAIIIGTEEIKQKNCIVKNLAEGKQRSIPFDELSSFLLEHQNTTQNNNA